MNEATRYRFKHSVGFLIPTVFLMACEGRADEERHAVATTASAALTSECNDHGDLDGAGQCVCLAGFTGTTCSQCDSNYYGYPGCKYCLAATTCNGHGSCDTAGACACSTGFAGTTCDTCDSNYYGYPGCKYCLAATTCSGHGSCDNTGACACSAGFTGTSCETCAVDYYALPTCKYCLARTTCTGHGSCNSSGTCTCDPGFTGADCIPPAPPPSDDPLTSYLAASQQAQASLVSCTALLTAASQGQQICSSDLATANAALAASDAALAASDAARAAAAANPGSCQNALTRCQTASADADGDGTPDRLDVCPGTNRGDTVDASGCSLAQFCARVDADRPLGVLLCLAVDWQNDEPLGSPSDCRVRVQSGVKRCVPDN